MSLTFPLRSLAAATTAATVLGGLAIAAPTTATAAPTVAPATVTTVTAFLRAPNPVGLQALAATQGLTHAQRVRALASLVPSTATTTGVTKTMIADGLAVVGQTAWSVTATGTASTISSLFGTRPEFSKTLSQQDQLLARGELPKIPAALRASVTAVFPTNGGPAVLHHSATSTLAGADFRNADTPAGVAASTGLKDGTSTVATVQFADFYGGVGVDGAQASTTAADLTSYATEHSLPDPVADKKYRAVRIGDGPSSTDDAMGGDVEVNLDQESILSTAPSANQHAYFAPNTDAGFGDVFSAVFDDVVGNSHATAADPNIIALSSSWGECEAVAGSAMIKSVEPILESLVAAGVTVFSASGDDGIYDCRSTTGAGVDNSQADVDYPASSPSVVAVGGSNLSATTSAPNTGTNWTETAWSCTDPASCESSLPVVGTGGTGGGASGSADGTTTENGTADFAGFAAPEYQQIGIDDAPFAGAAKRLLPDITADGDPETGFTLYTSNPQYVIEGGGSNDLQVGGTSLATPISAAQLTNALADAGRHTGVGDIHGAIYSAYQETGKLAATNPKKVFRDVTVGTNGDTADKGTDPSVSAQTGYDTTSGVGGVLWSALAPYLTDTKTPTSSATLALPNLYKPTKTLAVTGKWTSSQGKDSSLLGHTTVTVTALGTTKPVYSTTTTKHSGSIAFTAKPGTTYRISAVATDISGRHSTAATDTLVAPIDDKHFTFSKKGWHRLKIAGSVARSHAYSTKKGATAKMTGTGRTFTLRYRARPDHGKIAIYHDGKLLRKVNEYAKSSGYHTITIFRSRSRARQTFTVKVLAKKVKASHGVFGDVDALYVGY